MNYLKLINNIYSYFQTRPKSVMMNTEKSTETTTELIVYIKRYMRKLSIYFHTERYLQFESSSYPVKIDYFL